jgi:ABC-type branched-subunit amino acid transport system substrate-binding protein
LIAPPTDSEATSLIRGAELAVASVNSGGDASVTLETRSEAGQWGSVGNDAVVLVSQRHVDAVITSADGADAHLVLQVSGRTRVPVATLCADMSVTSAGIPWMLRMVPANDVQARALFAAAKKVDTTATRWCLVVPSGRPARVVRHDVETAGREVGVIVDRTIELDAKANLPALSRSVATTSKAVLLWLPAPIAGSVAAELRAAGFRGVIAGPCPLASSAFIAAAKAAATGVLVPRVVASPESIGLRSAFTRDYEQRYGASPDFSAAASHDAILTLVAALRPARPDKNYRAFPVTRASVGATGPLHFDSAGNRTDALEVVTYRNGLWQ